MAEQPPPQRPEGELLQNALEQDGRSIRVAAHAAGMSDARWRQIVKGWMTTAGHTTEVVAPAATLAKMALVVGLSPAQLRSVKRTDAADILERILSGGDKEEAPAPARPSTGGQPDEIDLIFASSTMTARQKLERIRMVLQLRAQAEAEESQPSTTESTRREDAPAG